MMSYEYKVVPAPARGLKAKGIKTAEHRFAHALETAMNELAGDGWEYLRADTLPCEQREGLMSKTTVYQNMLVFRRTKVQAKPAIAAPKPAIAPPQPQPELTEEKKLIATRKTDDNAETQPDTATDAGKKSGSSADVAAE
nr:DUF4177 domain-containing protein [Roseobacter sp. CCS2]